jgi:hypothetical protein
MAISDEEIIEFYSKLNKCLITWKILDIKPTSINWCTTSLSMMIKSDSWYYLIKAITTTKKDSQECWVTDGYNWDSYKNDIGKEKTLLIDKKSELWLITTWEYWIKQFPDVEICKPNLTTKDYYLNYVLPNYKNEIIKSNHTVYYVWIFILLVILLSVLIYKKLIKQKK